MLRISWCPLVGHSGRVRCSIRSTKESPQLTKNEAAISIAVKRVTAKTSRRTPGLDEITWVDPHERLEGRDILL